MPYAVNPKTGEVVILQNGQWVPAPMPQAEGATVGGVGGPIIAGMAEASNKLGRAAARVVNTLLPGQPIPEPQADPQTAEQYPVATAIGGAAPYMVPIPGGFLANVVAGAGEGALMEPDPVRGAIEGGASSGAGYAAGNMAGRVVSGIRALAKGIQRELPSGIRQTTGEALNNPNMMAMEQSAARGWLTGRPFRRIRAGNEALLARKSLGILGQEGDQLTEASIGQAWQESVDAIRTAVPDEALIPVPEAAQAAIKRFNALPDEIVEIQAGATLTGKEFRNARSDILKLTKSPRATVREKAVETLDLLDQAAADSGTVNTDLYAQGRKLYRMWKTLTAPGVTRPGTEAGTLAINEASLDRTLGKQFGQQTTQGGKTTGLPEVDDLIQTVRDIRRTRDFTKGSVTTTGLSLPVLAADVANTGGLGSLGLMALSEASQAPGAAAFGAGFAQPQGAAGEAAAALARAAAEEIDRRKRKP